MDVEDGGKPRPEDLEKPTVGFDGSCLVVKAKASEWPFVVLRVLAICASLSATLVMALNKQTKTMVVALVGNTPITGTVTAKFQQTPAFVFFVIANAIATFHNISLLLLRLYGSKLQIKGLGLLVTISDMMTVSLVSAASAGAAAMAELGKNGNTHARWNKICDRFETFCDHGGGALIASFISVGLLMALNALSTVALYKNQACR